MLYWDRTDSPNCFRLVSAEFERASFASVPDFDFSLHVCACVFCVCAVVELVFVGVCVEGCNSARRLDSCVLESV